MGNKIGISNTIRWHNDFETSINNDGKIVATWSYDVDTSSARSTKPEIGDACTFSGWTDLYVTNVRLQNQGNNTTLGTVTFEGNEWGTNGDEETGPSNFSTELDIQISEQSLMTHSLFVDIPADRKQQILKLTNGNANLKIDESNVYLTILDDKENHPNPILLSESEGMLAKLLFAEGTESYLCPHLVYRVNMKTNNPLLTMPGRVGTIVENPYGDPPDKGENQNWLLVGLKQVYNNVYYDISLEYWLSGRGIGWNQSIYAYTME